MSWGGGGLQTAVSTKVRATICFVSGLLWVGGEGIAGGAYLCSLSSILSSRMFPPLDVPSAQYFIGRMPSTLTYHGDEGTQGYGYVGLWEHRAEGT